MNKDIAGAMIGAGGSIGGSLIGGVFGSLQGEKQWQRQKDAMALQYGYNEKMANNNQERNKQMWDYTNYENQKQHMINAGLNPALMYGMSGGGGTSSSGGQGSGVSQQQDQSIAAAQRGQEMGLQLAQIASQIKVNESQAEKNKAEAEKTAGVDTEAQKATIENIIALTTNEAAKNELIYADKRLKDAEAELKGIETGYVEGKTKEVSWSIQQIIREVNRLDRTTEGLKLDNELKRKTMDNRIKETQLILENTAASTFEKMTKGQVNQEQAKEIVESIKQEWQQIGINSAGKEQGWRELELKAEDIANKLNIGKGQIDVKDKSIIKDYILGIGELIMNSMKGK